MLVCYVEAAAAAADDDDDDVIMIVSSCSTDCCSTVQGPHEVASQMVTVLKHIIGESSWTSARLQLCILTYLIIINNNVTTICTALYITL